MDNKLVKSQDAIEAVYDAFCYAYCDNCEKNMDDDLCEDCHRKYQNWSASKKTIEKVINALPSAEPEIIRCKDCKYRDPEDKSCGCGHDIIWQLPRDDNWFCADGKRMADDPSHPFADDVMMG